MPRLSVGRDESCATISMARAPEFAGQKAQRVRRSQINQGNSMCPVPYRQRSQFYMDVTKSPFLLHQRFRQMRSVAEQREPRGACRARTAPAAHLCS